MMRHVACSRCIGGWRAMVGLFDGEDVKIIEGRMIMECRCDECNAQMEVGTNGACVSVSTSMTPYTAWEREYLVVEVTL